MATLTFYGGVGEIGGNKILVEADGTRIFLDFGMSFNQSNMYFAEFLQPKKCNGVLDFIKLGLLPRLGDMSRLYRVDYLSHCGMEASPSAGYDAVFLSHAHADHSAYIHFLRPDIPVYASEVTRRILAAMEETSAGGFNEFLTYHRTFETRPNKKGERVTRIKGEEAKEPRNFSGLTPGDTIAVGSITVEMVAVNHSIPGAVGYLIHTPGGTIAYSGDLRFHGYGGDLTRQFVERAAEAHPVALICEGTRIDEGGSHSEQYVQDRVTEIVRRTKNLVIANYPWKDIERLRSFHEVAKATGRKLALNLKQAYLLRKLEGTDAGVPALDDGNIVIYIDRKGWGLITKQHCLDYPPNVIEQDYKAWESEFLSYPNRVTCDDIHNHQSDYIVRIDFFDLTDLVNIRPDKGSCYIRSVTEPFDDEGQIELRRVENWLEHFGLMPYEQAHASGHASGPEIKRLVGEINPAVVFPIHTEAPERFREIKGVKVEIPETGRAYNL